MRDEIWKSVYLQMVPIIYRGIMENTISLDHDKSIPKQVSEHAARYADEAVLQYKLSEEEIAF